MKTTQKNLKFRYLHCYNEQVPAMQKCGGVGTHGPRHITRISSRSCSTPVDTSVYLFVDMFTHS